MMKLINLTFFGVLLVVLTSCESNFFNIPTPSMEQTLPVGSKIFVDKMSQINNGDIVVFKFNSESDGYWVFRLVAKAGDTLEIADSEIFINNHKQAYPNTIQHRYFIQSKQSLGDKFFEKYNIKDYQLVTDNGYLIFATDETYRKLKGIEGIDSIIRTKEERGDGNDRLYKDFIDKSWNNDYFGPILIPKKGEKIIFNDKNRGIYNELILKNEGTDISRLDEYQFKKDYVFVLGDNRDNALDSRFIGLIPQENILGKVKLLF